MKTRIVREDCIMWEFVATSKVKRTIGSASPH